MVHVQIQLNVLLLVHTTYVGTTTIEQAIRDGTALGGKVIELS